MNNFVGTPQLIFLHAFSFVSYIFVNIADMQIIKNLTSYNLINIPSLGINLVQILVI